MHSITIPNSELQIWRGRCLTTNLQVDYGIYFSYLLTLTSIIALERSYLWSSPRPHYKTIVLLFSITNWSWDKWQLNRVSDPISGIKVCQVGCLSNILRYLAACSLQLGWWLFQFFFYIIMFLFWGLHQVTLNYYNNDLLED